MRVSQSINMSHYMSLKNAVSLSLSFQDGAGAFRTAAAVMPLFPNLWDECSVEMVEKATGLTFDEVDLALGMKLNILSSFGASNASGTFTRSG